MCYDELHYNKNLKIRWPASDIANDISGSLIIFQKQKNYINERI